MNKLKILSYNVNGIRAALKKDLDGWLKKENPDIICLQETKAQADQVDPEVFNALGYVHQHWFSAEKKGYSGVATFSKIEPKKVVCGMKIDAYDKEGRMIRTDFEDFSLYNCYFPSGSAGEERHGFKMEFLNDLAPWFKKKKRNQKNIILVGDYNVVHQDIDIHNPQRKDKPSGFRPEERAWMDEWFKKDYIDAYRKIHGNKEDQYTWWSYRSGARKNNKGWRIDYISVSKALSDRVIDAKIHSDAHHSDHCPISIDLSL